MAIEITPIIDAEGSGRQKIHVEAWRTGMQMTGTPGKYVYFNGSGEAVEAEGTGAVAAPSSNRQSGTAYTAVAADADRYTLFTSASAVAFTIPAGVFSDGDIIQFEQEGAGAVTVVAGSGVTIHSRGDDLTLAGQHSPTFLRCKGDDTFTLSGDL